MSDSFDKLREIFLGALEQSPAQRQEYLDQICAGDSKLRGNLELMLQAQAAGEGPLDRCAFRDEQTRACEPVSEATGTVIGQYKLLELLGEGGMGTVWMAQQTEPVKRVVALKLIKAGMDSKQVIARFEAERQALALMDHPNIARVLDAGTIAAGRPYFVMDLVKGMPITRYCDEHRLTPHQRLELFLSVCQAVQHAHQKGIIHRDLKPSNVLVAVYDCRPVPKVIDFGVAKAVGQPLTEQTLVTGFGNIVGTLEYMAPEQAEVNQLDIDTRSDIYSLGVLLYELLTGSPPFTRKYLEKAGMIEMLRAIREQEPSKPSTKLSTAEGLPTLAANRGTEPAKLTKLVRGELDWIVMKALEKDRNRRYETANGFAMDVQRYLADEPVQACSPSVGYRMRKFVRRNRGPVLASSLLMLVLLGAIVGTAFGMVRAAHERDEKDAALRREQRIAYQSSVALAHWELELNNVGRADELLEACAIDLRGWEWRYLRRLRFGSKAAFAGHTDRLTSVAISADGRRVISASEDRTLRIWDLNSGHCLQTLRGHSSEVRCVALSGDGRHIVSGSSVDLTPLPLLGCGSVTVFVPPITLGEVIIWDSATGKEIAKWVGHWGPVQSVKFGRTGQTVVSAGVDGDICIWDAASGQRIRTIRAHSKQITCLAFDSSGLRLASAGMDGAIKVWDPKVGQQIHQFQGHRDGTQGISFSPDGRSLASAGWDSTARVWDVATGEKLHELIHPCPALGVAFTPDGKRLATAGWDKTVKLWNVATGEEILTLRGHGRPIQALDFSGDGCLLATASEDATVRLWDATPLGERAPFELFTLVHAHGVFALAYSRDGRYLAAAGLDHAVTLWDPITGRMLQEFGGDAGMVWGLVLSPDGRRLATATWDGMVHVWDSATGTKIYSEEHNEQVWAIEFSPDGRRLASGHGDGSVIIRDANNFRTLSSFRDGGAVDCLAFSPNGQHLVSAGTNSILIVRDSTTGEIIHTLKGHRDCVRGVAYSPDGRYIASASYDETIRIWNAATGESHVILRGHQERVWNVAFSPDSKLLASACLDATVKVWDVASGDEIQTLRGNCGQVRCVAFRADGLQLAAASGHFGKGEVRIWDAEALRRRGAQPRARQE